MIDGFDEKTILSIVNQTVTLKKFEMLFLQLDLIASSVYQIVILMIQQVAQFVQVVDKATDDHLMRNSFFLNTKHLFVLKKQWRQSRLNTSYAYRVL